MDAQDKRTRPLVASGFKPHSVLLSRCEYRERRFYRIRDLTKTEARKTGEIMSGLSLFARPSGQWAKKIKGQILYFSEQFDPGEALATVNRDGMYSSQGRTPLDSDMFGDVMLKIGVWNARWMAVGRQMARSILSDFVQWLVGVSKAVGG